MSDVKNKPRLVFISGRKVNLRPFSKDDVPTVTKWINDPEVREFVSRVFPQTEKQEEDWFEKLGSNEHNVILCIETKNHEPIGVMGLHGINWIYRHATTGAMIGEKDYWGKGYGTDAKMHLLEYAFHTLNLHRIESYVIEFNKRSLNYSLRCGYKEEGRSRQHIFRNGKYWDLIQLGLLYEDWLPVWEKFKKKED